MTSHQSGLAEQMLEIGLVQRQIKGEKKKSLSFTFFVASMRVWHVLSSLLFWFGFVLLVL